MWMQIYVPHMSVLSVENAAGKDATGTDVEEAAVVVDAAAAAYQSGSLCSLCLICQVRTAQTYNLLHVLLLHHHHLSLHINKNTTFIIIHFCNNAFTFWFC